MVLFHHAQAFSSRWWFGPHSGFGAAGVDIFFVLSGAIIYKSAFSPNRTTAAQFARKRVTRIAPLWYVASFAWLPLCASAGWPTTATGVLTTLTFWPVWAGGMAFPVDSVGWTLCFEMLFYVAAALCLVSPRFLSIVMAVFVFSWWARRHGHSSAAFEFLGNPIILEFLLGVIIAAIFNRTRGRVPLLVSLTFMEAGFFLIVLYGLPPGMEDARMTLNNSYSLLRALVWGVPAGIIVFGALAIEPHVAGKWVNTAVFLGDASYAVYLIHWPVLAIVGGVITPWLQPSVGLTVLLFAVGLGSGLIGHAYVERPLIAAIRRWPVLRINQVTP
jgi:exopolysaccharide production protein ExoZ